MIIFFLIVIIIFLSTLIFSSSFRAKKKNIRYRNLLNVVKLISKTTKAVRYGDLTQNIPINNDMKPEIQELIQNTNNMIESLRDREFMIKEYRSEIEEQKTYLETILNSLNDGLITITADGVIRDINPIISLWLKHNENHLIGKNFSEYFSCNCNKDCNINNFENNCPIIQQSERYTPTEIKIKTTTNQMILSPNISVAKTKNNEKLFVITLRDITNVKELYEIKKDFIATLTHDLKVPIIAETNALNLLYKGTFGDVNPKQKEAIQNMVESNDELLLLVNSLLDIYKYESDENLLDKELVDINNIILNVLKEFEHQAKKNNQIVNFESEKNITKVNLDKNQIKRVFRNLIDNAISYTPKNGEISIKTSINNGKILIIVEDNGKGISEEDKEKIFQRFFSRAKKFRKIGTGLGLYLSKQIIEKHNGNIWIESELGKGSKFFIELPL